MDYLDINNLDELAGRKLPIESGNGESPETAYPIKEEVGQFLVPGLEKMVVDLTIKEDGGAWDNLFLQALKLTYHCFS